jgi:hypothetical protein
MSDELLSAVAKSKTVNPVSFAIRTILKLVIKSQSLFVACFPVKFGHHFILEISESTGKFGEIITSQAMDLSALRPSVPSGVSVADYAA